MVEQVWQVHFFPRGFKDTPLEPETFFVPVEFVDLDFKEGFESAFLMISTFFFADAFPFLGATFFAVAFF
ncbi:hypothetical protein LEP1GSC137_4092 [Leptospira borgpetersenii str. Noumea 25]|nr:hypothetical protein LEP1GSC137_4092 [Leptospira borgpetersenii str. Noumea 25]